MKLIHRRFIMCPSDHLTPVVPAHLRRCTDCPTQVWVPVTVLSTVIERGEAEPLCFACAHRVIRLSWATPAVVVLPEYEHVLAANGSLDEVRELTAGLNSSRLAMESYAALMEQRYCR